MWGIEWKVQRGLGGAAWKAGNREGQSQERDSLFPGHRGGVKGCLRARLPGTLRLGRQQYSSLQGHKAGILNPMLLDSSLPPQPALLG